MAFYTTSGFQTLGRVVIGSSFFPHSHLDFLANEHCARTGHKERQICWYGGRKGKTTVWSWDQRMLPAQGELEE